MREAKAYSINEFCDTYNICRSHFYKLKSENKAPKLKQVGRKVLIAIDDAEAWFAAL